MINKKTVRSYCCDDISLIKNYDIAILDDKQTWDCHHIREINENKTPKQLISEGLYYKRPAIELIFLTKSEHAKLHQRHNPTWLNKHLTEGTKQKISEKLKGRPSPMKGKNLSEETKQILREIHKKQWLDPIYRQKVIDGVKMTLNKPEVKQKRAEVTKKKWQDPIYRQKQIEAAKKNWENPEYRQKQSEARKGEKNGFFGKHHTEETKQKMRKPKPKYLWLADNGDQIWMAPSHVAMHHKDWKLIHK